jgi:hypothetical protein
MIKISFTRSSIPPAIPPLYDPREGIGLSFHADTSSSVIWLGLGKTSPLWGRFLFYETVEPNTEGSGSFNVNPPIVTTSNLPPDVTPQFIPSEGRLHIHISYDVDDRAMFIGTSKEPPVWAKYAITSLA